MALMLDCSFVCRVESLCRISSAVSAAVVSAGEAGVVQI